MLVRRIFTSFGSTTLVVMVASCATPEYRAAETGCSATYMSEIPPKFEQEIYNETQSREVPTGHSTCTTTGNTTNCQQDMKTEYFTIPSIRTVDRNKPLRDAKIQACAQQKCIKDYGNAECKPG